MSESHAGSDPNAWVLRLYIAGQTPKSITAVNNLTELCKQIQNPYTVEVIDLRETPERARDDQILAIPTLVRRFPEPVRRIIGDLSNTRRVLIGLDILPRDSAPDRLDPPVSSPFNTL